MAYDEGIAELLRADLTDFPGVTEKRMFGGLVFMLRGHMLCGAHGQGGDFGGMFRVGKAREPEALALDGVTPLSFTGRPMGGLVDMTSEAIGDDTIRAAVLSLALAFNGEQTPK